MKIKREQIIIETYFKSHSPVPLFIHINLNSAISFAISIS